MKKKPVLLITFILLSHVCYAQSSNISKLQQQLPFIKDSLRYVDALNRIAMLSYEKNIDTTFYYTARARAIADRLQYQKGRADAENNIGIVFDVKSNLQLALRYYNDAYNLYKTIHDSSNIVQAIMNIATVYQESGKNEKAVREFKKALNIGQKLSRDSIMALVCYNYALAYPDSINKDSLPVYIRRAGKIALRYHDDRTLLAIQQLIADNLIRTGERERGVALLQRTIAKAIQSDLNYISMDMLTDLGDVLAKTDSAKAVGYYQQGLQITVQKGYKVYTELFTKKLYDFYLAKKDNNEAFKYSQKLLSLYSEQKEVDNNSGIDYIEYALKDQQLKSAQTQSGYQLLFLFFAVLVCTLTIFIIILLWHVWKQSRKTNATLQLQFEESETTMEALDLMNKNYARLIKVIAHDLRNPISAIHSITEIVTPETLDDETKELISLVRTSSKSCLELISELLEADFDQQQNFNKEAVNINELLGQCVRLLNLKAESKQQHIVLNSRIHGTIPGDYEKLWRMMNNLVVNAIKFSPAGSEIVVEAKEAAGGMLISIKDSGIGIPADIQNKIFDPFTTSRRMGTDGEQPFGLGLYICKQIVDAHNGRIWLESEEGKGTTFYVELPVE